MFRVLQHPSSGVLKTVTATSGIGHNVGTATSFHRNYLKPTDQHIPQDLLTPVLIRPRWKEVTVPIL